MTAHDIIIRPVVTEKSMKDVANGKYVFAVAQAATKDEIKNAIQKTFDVHVVSVATSIVKGKKKRAGAKRLEVKQSIWKKATVAVKAGEKIWLFEPGGKKDEKAEKKGKK